MINRSKIEDELRCQSCRQWLQNPLLLPCGHSICSSCASHRLQGATEPDQLSECSSNSQSNLNIDDTDGVSTVSEADSGVVLSRPNSYVSSSSLGSLLPSFPTFELLSNCPTPIASSNASTVSGSSNNNSLSFPGGSNIIYKLTCRLCRRTVYLGESGIECLPRNRAIENLLNRFVSEQSATESNACPKHYCQLCDTNHSLNDHDGSKANEAVRLCEQCETLYCSECLERCHPSRGPLAKHNLLEVNDGLFILSQKRQKREWSCPVHMEERLDLYCGKCRIPLCCRCVQEGNCRRHQVHPLSTQCKMHKNELSKILQSLSEQAKSGTEFIQNMKSSTDKINKHMSTLETEVNQTIDRLIDQLEEKRSSLLTQLHLERDHKARILREQAGQCSKVLAKTTSLLHFCVEMLKEADPGAFILACHALIGRAQRSEQNFLKEMDNMQPRVKKEFEMKLETEALERCLDSLSFTEYKAPDVPAFHYSSCSVEANSLTAVWGPTTAIPIDYYTLEIDDGFQGNFKVAYRGSETICTVDHLHFKAIYRIRVRAHNYAGASDFSDVLRLHTSSVSLFTLDGASSHCDLTISADGLSVWSGDGDYDDKVATANTGFSRGIHYWEFRVDKYTGQGQPAFGIAKPGCTKDKMLGSDPLSWSMYLNGSRSWFHHNGEHSERTDGGLLQGAIIGIRLDCDRGILSYYLNSEPQGPIAFNNLHTSLAPGLFYPAISLSHGAQVTLLTGLEPPSESEESEGSEDEALDQLRHPGYAASLGRCSTSSSGSRKSSSSNIMTHSSLSSASSVTTHSLHSNASTVISAPSFNRV